MTPAAIYTAVRDFLIIAAIAFVVYRVFVDGKNAVKAGDLKALQAQMSQQNEIVTQWHTQATKANEQLSQDLHAINTAPVVVHDWVRPSDSCAKAVLPVAPAATGNSSAAAGGDQPVGGTTAEGSRRDIILADWKRFWETRLADCRVLYDGWPQP